MGVRQVVQVPGLHILGEGLARLMGSDDCMDLHRETEDVEGSQLVMSTCL